MKKTLFAIIIFMMFIGISNAAKCNVVSGTGKNIGDEIACGSEHFYVIKNDEKNIKMLSKYNLYVGFNYEHKELDKPYDTIEEALSYIEAQYIENYDEILDIYQDENGKYSSVLLYKVLNTTEIKQDSEAIGAHGGEQGSPELTQKGIINLRDGGYSEPEKYSEGYGGNYFYDYTLLKDGLIEPYIRGYYDSLNKEYNIQDVTMLSVQDLNNLVYDITAKELPLEEWGTGLYNNDMNLSAVYIVGSIKNLLPEKYNWIYSTTYWTRTISVPHEVNAYIYFIDTLGDLCAVGSCGTVAGAGIRPLVTMSADNLVYNIKTKTDSNGTITPSTEIEESGKEVKFVVTPNKGYMIDVIKVTDSNGKEVTFTDYTFTMPSADVQIEASFKIIPVEDNPGTSDITILICIILILISIITTYLSVYKISKTI